MLVVSVPKTTKSKQTVYVGDNWQIELSVRNESEKKFENGFLRLQANSYFAEQVLCKLPDLEPYSKSFPVFLNTKVKFAADAAALCSNFTVEVLDAEQQSLQKFEFPLIMRKFCFFLT